MQKCWIWVWIQQVCQQKQDAKGMDGEQDHSQIVEMRKSETMGKKRIGGRRGKRRRGAQERVWWQNWKRDWIKNKGIRGCLLDFTEGKDIFIEINMTGNIDWVRRTVNTQISFIVDASYTQRKCTLQTEKGVCGSCKDEERESTHNQTNEVMFRNMVIQLLIR